MLSTKLLFNYYEKTLFLLLSVATLAINLASCKKDSLQSSQQVQSEKNLKDITFQNGMLIFKDSLTFELATKALLAGTDKSGELWEKQFEGFQSYRSLFAHMQNELSEIKSLEGYNSFKKAYTNSAIFNDDFSISPKYGSPRLSMVSNKDGKFMIGSQLNIITSDRWISLENPTQQRINTALGLDKSNVKDNIYVSIFGGVLKSNNSQKNNKYSALNLTTGMNYQNVFYNDSNDRRLYVQIFTEAFPGGWGTNSVKMYIKLFQEAKGFFGGWSFNNTDYTQVNLEYNMTLANHPPMLNSFAQTSGPGGYYQWTDVKGPVFYDVINNNNVIGFVQGDLIGSYTSRGVGITNNIHFIF